MRRPMAASPLRCTAGPASPTRRAQPLRAAHPPPLCRRAAAAAAGRARRRRRSRALVQRLRDGGPRPALGAARGAPAGAGAAGRARRGAGRAAGRHHPHHDGAGRGHAGAGAGAGRWPRPTSATARRWTRTGQRIEFWIVGMGKLGARELNVSSDIDLIYVYEDDGQTDGPRPMSCARVLRAGGQAAVRADRRHHRRRLRLPRRPGAAAQRQLGPAGGEPGHAGGVPAGAGPRVGALRLAEEPRRGAARRR